MKKLFTSTLLTVVAVPFLMASPSPKAHKAQTADSAQAPDTNQATTKKAKKHHKKHKGATTTTQDSTAAPKQ